MTSCTNPAPQEDAHMKEYGLNKPTPFSGNQTKIKVFLQECLVYIDMNEEIYTMDKLKIGFVLLYMNKKEARDWQELYLKNLKDPATGKLVYPTFGTFLAEVRKAFRSGDQIQDAICKLENLKQGKKTVEQIMMEFKQLIRQAGLTMRMMSDNIHLIGLVTNSFSSLQHAYHAFTNSFSYMIEHAFPSRLTCLVHMFTIPLPHEVHVFASRPIPLLYLFKPVVRCVYSLAFH